MGATWRNPAFFGASGSLAVAVAWVDSWFSVLDLVISQSPSAVITAVTTSIALVGDGSKSILQKKGPGFSENEFGLRPAGMA